MFKPLRAELEPTGQYRFLDSQRSLGITHKPTNTKLRVQSSNGKTAMGLVNVPVLIADEPGAWEVSGGQLMWDAIATALGKPGSTMRVILIGTLAPAMSGWWHDLIAAGTHDHIYVQSLVGRSKKWDSWKEISRVNPLMSKFTESRRQLRIELKEAQNDTRLKARFISYRLNRPTADESEILLTDEDWSLALKRPVPDADGAPVVGMDLGQGRSWSAAVAVWPNGRIEALACAPGIPSLEEQETRDKVPSGTYTKLEDTGRLIVADGLQVQPVASLIEAIIDLWGAPSTIIADRFRVAEIEDYSPCEVVPRVTRWSEAGEDIRILRKWCKDGPLAVERESRKLITASLMVSMVKSDDQGNCRLAKRGFNGESRDDVSAAMLLGVGEADRQMNTPQIPFQLLHVA